ncbi:MAG: ATP-binding cassette domain-containing protein [Synergistaceae bacterium]|jgi:lipopolysaccharide transport system ATP-binding protein|nr:ATP-binding cassette domain-containing protein [Synergistaceae bacterium]
MSNTVIKIENLGKKYMLAHKQLRKYIALRDVLMDRAKRLGRRWLHPFSDGAANAPGTEEFWALSDASFDVKRGDRVGIIGRNGSGKSTLFKILSRITEPTTGRVSIKGRIASLLEVGTGFHPELTGRENVYLNGAILGMSKVEIQKNFDAIVDFAGVEQFLDTPVKHYSSGMYVRLAFAVAAHLDTEILLIDEVLAVGDAEFQKKCMGKMDEVSHKEGRTILFVSHNMGAIRQLCKRVVHLGHGKIISDTEDVAQGINTYLQVQQTDAGAFWTNPGNAYPNRWFVPLKFGLSDREGRALPGAVHPRDEAWVQIEGMIDHPNPALTVGYSLYSSEGTLIYSTSQADLEDSENALGLLKGKVSLRSRLFNNLLNAGTYFLEFNASLHRQEWINQPGVNAPSVLFRIDGSLSSSPYWMGKKAGILSPSILWERC